MIEDRQRTRRVDREAADWFSRLNQTRVENEDLTAFAEWRRAPENLAAYNRIEDISRAVRGLADDPDIQAAARQARQRPAARRVTWPALERPMKLWAPALGLAGLVAASVVGWLAFTAPTYSTAVGEQLSARLDDGSRVQLNTDTRVRVRFTGGVRRVELLRGQAFFDVAHDTARPFIVAAGPARVRAVGTKFDVRREPGEVRVTLAEGKVAVHDGAGGKDWMLAPGQSLDLGARARLTHPTAVDVRATTAWTTGYLTFHDVTLGEAVAEINRYTRQKIVLSADAPTDRKVSGMFPTGDTADFLAAVGTLYGLKAHRRPDGRLELTRAHEPAA